MGFKNYFPCLFVFSTTLILVLFVLFFISYYKFGNQEITVHTNYGAVKGHQVIALNKTVYEFLGIRYAKPPTGELRFKKPTSVQSWSGVYDATKRGNICWQVNNTKYNVKYMNEDCLFLNIWSTGFSNKKPVLFWIHGGGFLSGTAYRETMNGSALATFDVVIVSFNYRLGPFGFLYGGNDETPGNVGLFDQWFALKWVKENIESFGGDPNEITIFGNSAGGISVGFHLISNLSKDLFKRAIVQSGAPYFLKLYIPSKEEYLNKTKVFSDSLGCNTNQSDWIKCIKQLNASQLIENNYSRKFNKPIIDDDFYKQTAQQTFQSGSFHSNVQILSGVMADEGTYFALPFFDDLNENVTKDQLKQLINIIVQSNTIDVDVDKIYNFYLANESESDQNSLKKAFSNILGDLNIVCPTIYLVDEFANLNNSLNEKVYFYKFIHKLKNRINSRCNEADWLGYCHAEDVPIVFGQAIIDPTSFTQEDYNFSIVIMTLWTNFAKNG